MKKSRVFYSLNEEDIQLVAIQEFGRELSIDEIISIEDKIADNINWYDAISNAIAENLTAKF